VINKHQITRRPGAELGCRGTERGGERRNLKKKRGKHRRGGEMKMRNEGDMTGGEVNE
jgi:hypothetical protein